MNALLFTKYTQKKHEATFKIFVSTENKMYLYKPMDFYLDISLNSGLIFGPSR